MARHTRGLGGRRLALAGLAATAAVAGMSVTAAAGPPPPAPPATDLSIVKSNLDPQNAGVRPGQTVSYQVAVRTSGPLAVQAAAIVVTDLGVALVYAGGDADLDQRLDPGETWLYGAGSGPVTRPAASCDDVVNTATVFLVDPTKYGVDANPANDSSTVVTDVLCDTDVALSKGSDKDLYAPGETVIYTVTVTNGGQTTIPFGQIQVSDPTAPLTLIGDAPTALAPGGVLTYRGSRTAAACGPLANTATVGLVGAPAETTTANNGATRTVTVSGAACNPPPPSPPPPTPPPIKAATTPPPPVATARTPRPPVRTTRRTPPPPVAPARRAPASVRVDKSGPVRVTAGQAGTYTIVIRNTSARPVTGLVISDRLPSGLSLARGLPRGARLDAGTVTWRVGRMAPRSSRAVRVQVRFDRTAAGRRCNTATVRATTRGVRTARDTACTAIRRIAPARVPPVTG